MKRPKIEFEQTNSMVQPTDKSVKALIVWAAEAEKQIKELKELLKEVDEFDYGDSSLDITNKIKQALK